MKIDFHKRENVFDCGNVPNIRNHTYCWDNFIQLKKLIFNINSLSFVCIYHFYAFTNVPLISTRVIKNGNSASTF